MSAPSRHFPLQGQWWEVSTNGEYVGVRATLGTSTEIRQLVAALQCYLPFMEEREKNDAGPVRTHWPTIMRAEDLP